MPNLPYKTHKDRRRSRREVQREALLGLLGDDFAPLAKQFEDRPAERRLAAFIRPIFRTLDDPENRQMRHVTESWSTLIGPDFAGYAEPRRIYRGVLYVEVFQPARLLWLRQFVLANLTRQVHQLTKDQVREVRLVPAGSTPD